MAKHTRFKGETILQRPNMVRCRYELSNGQLLSVYFTRNRVRKYTGISYVWTVGVHIGRTRQEANAWYNHKERGNSARQTGTCGLEGLATACRYIRSFASLYIRHRSELQIGWMDDKRRRAYQYLLRYPGFALYEGECLAYRSPDHYEWIPNKKEEDLTNV